MKYFTREDLDNLYLKENKSWTKIVKLLQSEEATKKNHHFKSFERIIECVNTIGLIALSANTLNNSDHFSPTILMSIKDLNNIA